MQKKREIKITFNKELINKWVDYHLHDPNSINTEKAEDLTQLCELLASSHGAENYADHGSLTQISNRDADGVKKK